jgi:hypothetical protein
MTDGDMTEQALDLARSALIATSDGERANLPLAIGMLVDAIVAIAGTCPSYEHRAELLRMASQTLQAGGVR